MKNGLYIITHVVDGYHDKAFVAFLVNNEEAKIEEEVNIVKYEITNLTPKQESLYKLMHRRFNYLGPRKIRNLYKVIIISTLIKILIE